MRRSSRNYHRPASQRILAARTNRRQGARPAAAFRQRFHEESLVEGFGAPETWHEPDGRSNVRFTVEPAGESFIHPVTVGEVKERIALLPAAYRRNLEVIQFSRMTRKRTLFPCYGMQW